MLGAFACSVKSVCHIIYTLLLRELTRSRCFFRYNKVVTGVMIGLKTTKGTKTLKLAPQIYESLQKEKVSIGDVIYIEANTGSAATSCVRT